MNAELKSKWVEALRSGEYVQGTEGLRSPAGAFCCIGVLCDVIDPSGWNPSREYVFNGDSRLMYMPDPLADRMGIAFETQEMLASLNDEGQSFHQIADFIEQNIPADAS